MSASTPPSSPCEDLSILILTRNEALHIQRSVAAALELTPHVFVVDSHSSDGTAALAQALGAHVQTVDFTGFSDKLNWCLNDLHYPTTWVMRLDADERFSEPLRSRLASCLAAVPEDVNGITLRRQLWFMGKWIKRGGMYPTYSMRIWRQGQMTCEVRQLDEHMLLRSGRSMQLDLDVIDDPLYDLTAWISKHNGYASLQALSELEDQTSTSAESSLTPSLWGSWAQRRRWLKTKVFYRLPLFLRPLLYFLHRYLFQGGFLDGRRGFIFHFMHGLWYRMLVDSKILESRMKQRQKA
jgi:glycosyltransferase involved in cell wall biosynthesis